MQARELATEKRASELDDIEKHARRRAQGIEDGFLKLSEAREQLRTEVANIEHDRQLTAQQVQAAKQRADYLDNDGATLKIERDAVANKQRELELIKQECDRKDSANIALAAQLDMRDARLR